MAKIAFELVSDATHQVGERVFVPGARCFGEVKGLFGGSASRVVLAWRVDTARIFLAPR